MKRETYDKVIFIFREALPSPFTILYYFALIKLANYITDNILQLAIIYLIGCFIFHLLIKKVVSSHINHHILNTKYLLTFILLCLVFDHTYKNFNPTQLPETFFKDGLHLKLGSVNITDKIVILKSHNFTKQQVYNHLYNLYEFKELIKDGDNEFCKIYDEAELIPLEQSKIK